MKLCLFLSNTDDADDTDSLGLNIDIFSLRIGGISNIFMEH